jgi:hypothetical protein
VRTWPVSVNANNAGVATAKMRQLTQGEKLTVSQVSVKSASILPSVCTLFLNSDTISETASGNSNTAAGDPTIQLSASDTMSVVWAGCTPGSQCQAVFFYQYRGRVKCLHKRITNHYLHSPNG